MCPLLDKQVDIAPTFDALSSQSLICVSNPSIVASIAYTLSNVVISVQPAQAVHSEFSPTLDTLANRKIGGVVASASNSLPEVGGNEI